MKTTALIAALLTAATLEVEYLCDRVGLLDEGRLLDMGTPGELTAKYSAENLEEVFIKATGSVPAKMGGDA